jgi:hypothetical protein
MTTDILPLRPCPKCSSKNVGVNGTYWKYITCDDCGNTSKKLHNNAISAIECWNKGFDIKSLRKALDYIRETIEVYDDYANQEDADCLQGVIEKIKNIAEEAL